MKYTEFNINSNKIEFLNSLFGTERILVNGTEVSKRFAFFGTKHKFEMDSEIYTLRTSFTALGKRELNLKLEKNQQLVEKRNIHLNPEQRTYWGAIVIIIGIILINAFTK